MIRCLIVDDEPLALRQLEKYISQVEFLELAASCRSAFDARKVLGNESIDVIFCDINMPDLDGMSFVKSLADPPLVVFTTAYSDYAVDGFKVNAVDYLLKPFGLTEFKSAARKVKQRLELGRPQLSSSREESESIYLKADYKIVRVETDKILFVEGMSEYLKIYLSNREDPVVVLLSMKKMEESLPADKFMRIHKSFIINLGKIVQLSKGMVLLEGGKNVPIGDSYKDAFMDYIGSRFLVK